MNYIDPVEYSKLLKSFTQGATKKVIKESVDKKEEGMHLGQPTSPTTVTVEGGRNYKNLSVDERKQLKELIESVKTIKQEIKKLMEKATVGEGGDMTNKVLELAGGPLTPEEEEELRDIEYELGYSAQSDSAISPSMYKRYKELKAKRDADDASTAQTIAKYEKEKGEEDTVAGSIV